MTFLLLAALTSLSPAHPMVEAVESGGYVGETISQAELTVTGVVVDADVDRRDLGRGDGVPVIVVDAGR